MGKDLSATAGNRQACPAPPLSPTRYSAQNARRGRSVVWAQGARSIQKRCPPRTRGARGCALWRTTASGDRCVARGPPASGSEQPIARTLRTTSPRLFPPLVQLPDEPVSHRCSLGWVSQPGESSVLSCQGPESPPEAARAGHLSASCRRCCVRFPPPPKLGLQVNETLVFLSHLFCFPAKF